MSEHLCLPAITEELVGLFSNHHESAELVMCLLTMSDRGEGRVRSNLIVVPLPSGIFDIKHHEYLKAKSEERS